MSLAIKKKINEVIFTAVDSVYFKKYASVWAWSVYSNNMHGHIHVINPDKNDLSNLSVIQKNTKGKINFSTGDMLSTLPKDKSYFASFRFMYVGKLIPLYNKVLIIDVDSIVRKKIIFPSEDFGFMERESLQNASEWYKKSSKLAAGIFFINLKKTIGFDFKNIYLERLHSLHKHGCWQWMVDQNALHKVFLDIKKLNSFEIKQFDNSYLCWDFKDSAMIWTGKGAKKYNSKKYLNEFKKYLKDYQKKNKLSLKSRVLDFINQF